MKRIELLDYGRFLAAISVVAFHYFFNGIANGKISSITHIPEVIDIAKYGYLGVEFFFMISGYVIFLSAKNRSASEFLVSRAIRLYPAFWVAVIFTSLVAVFLGGERMSVSLPQVLANLTMASPAFGYNYVDGVYWTLAVELTFYIAVFFFLLIGLSKNLSKVFLIWPFAMLLAAIVGKSHFPYMGSYYCYFAAGTILAILKERITIPASFSLLTCLALCLRHSIGAVGRLSESKGTFYSGIIIGLIVLIFFLFFLFMNTKKGAELKLYNSRLLGDLTYPIYLTHAHVGYMVLNRFATDQNKYMVYAITFAFVLLMAYLIHILVEKKYLDAWETFFQKLLGNPVAAVSRRVATWRRQLS